MLALTIIATVGLLFLCTLSIIVAKQDSDYVLYVIIIILNSFSLLFHIWRWIILC